jgi:hypothetical protein
MDNNQIKFLGAFMILGACIIFGCSILAIAVGSLAYATSRYMGGAEVLPGVIGAALAVALGITVLVILFSSKDK